MRTTRTTFIGATALACGAAHAVVVYDGHGHIEALTGIAAVDALGERVRYDVRFVHADFYAAFPGTPPGGLPADNRIADWPAILEALKRQGADRVPFAGGQTSAYIPLLNTGLQSGYPCSHCVQSSYAFRALSIDGWAFGGIHWVKTGFTGDRHPAQAVGPTVTWVDVTRVSAVPAPPAAWTLLAGLAALGARRGFRHSS
jgi:hypothetical protein